MDQTQAARWLQIEARLLSTHPGLSDYENVLITSQRVQDRSGVRDDDRLSDDELTFLYRVRLEQKQENRPLPAQRSHSQETTTEIAGRRR